MKLIKLLAATTAVAVLLAAPAYAQTRIARCAENSASPGHTSIRNTRISAPRNFATTHSLRTPITSGLSYA